jgi:hypothetical protein
VVKLLSGHKVDEYRMYVFVGEDSSCGAVDIVSVEGITSGDDGVGVGSVSGSTFSDSSLHLLSESDSLVVSVVLKQLVSLLYLFLDGMTILLDVVLIRFLVAVRIVGLTFGGDDGLPIIDRTIDVDDNFDDNFDVDEVDFDGAVDGVGNSFRLRNVGALARPILDDAVDIDVDVDRDVDRDVDCG